MEKKKTAVAAQSYTIPAPSEQKTGTWSETATRVLRERYLLRDATGAIVETPDEMCWRVASAVAAAETQWTKDRTAVAKTAQRFYDMMVEHRFLPNSPTLMNAGKGNNLQLSACYVVPVEDSLEGIFEAVKHAALIHQSGGGTGFSFSRLRPKGSIVGSTHGVASGPVSFMKIFDGATEAVKQGGTRRGANMGVLRVDHPDIEEFIDCKRDGSVTNFNISVGVTEVFMQALENDAEYELVNPHDGIIAGTRRAREIMDKIVDAAWATGDPGLLFLDRANHSTANPIPEIERLEATNPCGEQWLGPYDACNLGSINVGLFVTRDERGKATDVDWAALEETTRLCVRFLDDVIDINPYPLEEVRAKVTANRRIGLGIMGWAELLFELGLRYDSDDAITLGERLMTSIRDWARSASEDIAAEREAFPNWSRSIYKNDKPLRNSTRTTVAPTGSISILAECSSGIEPIFALAFQHRVKQPDGGYRVLDFVNPFFERALMASDIEDKDGVLEYVKEHGSLHGHDAEEHPALRPFVTAHEIAPDWHIRMQAAFQRGVDNSISKTINLPNSATRDDVLQAYMQAWNSGCLGITIFRDGSKGEQVLNVGVKEEKKAEEVTVTRAAPTTSHRYTGGIKDRPEVVHGYTRQVRAPEGKVNITLNSDEDGLLEIFVNVGKAGSDIAALAEAVGRLASLNLRLDSPLSQNERAREIARQLKSIGGSASVGFGIQRVRSLPDAVARSLDQHFAGELGEQGGVGQEASGNGAGGYANGGNGGNGALGLNPMMMAQYTVSGNLCSHCGNNTMIYEEGCKKCASCGHSEC
ncbi:MAG TPA: adenosylcobalamin-dependent ribonucleoside-diphosphate reductase [Ktedonobacterales bacterium]|nr:adenosylcobalamin-dependent ribonucleoside-diphosphate reductase [Ktedonobacterales bacterium]